MATGKRYYWIKLKDNFFDDDGPADFLMSQPDGANYVVLYQMLCLKTINTNGRLSNQIGEVIIPYDIEKIRRTCKYFSADTIRIALNLYKALNLIYEDVNGTLVIAEYGTLVGSETDAAARMRNSRTVRNAALPAAVTDGEHCANNVTTEIRDKEIKSLEIRDKEIKRTEDLTVSDETVCCTSDVQRVIDSWNSLGLQTIKKIVPGSDRDKWLKKRIRDYSIDDVLDAIEKVRQSSFLMGDNKNGWQATFDWFIRPNNFPKVLSGNYDNRPAPAQQTKAAAELDGSYHMMEKWRQKHDTG